MCHFSQGLHILHTIINETYLSLSSGLHSAVWFAIAISTNRPLPPFFFVKSSSEVASWCCHRTLASNTTSLFPKIFSYFMVLTFLLILLIRLSQRTQYLVKPLYIKKLGTSGFVKCFNSSMKHNTVSSIPPIMSLSNHIIYGSRVTCFF